MTHLCQFYSSSLHVTIVTWVTLELYLLYKVIVKILLLSDQSLSCPFYSPLLTIVTWVTLVLALLNEVFVYMLFLNDPSWSILQRIAIYYCSDMDKLVVNLSYIKLILKFCF